MIKVFLVEDEMVMRNGIKKNIAWETEGFAFVGEASDGELAYPLIKKTKPDILITDIKMPFMDGLELSRIVKKELPQTKIIILSGYNDFEYAKTAISIGVTDYLLKPIGAAKLLEVLKKVAQMIEQEQEQNQVYDLYQKEMWENTQRKKHALWADLVTDQLSVMELMEQGEQLGLDLMASAYQVVLFKVFETESNSSEMLKLTELTDKIEEMTQSWEMILSFDRSPEGWAFLIKGESEEAIDRKREFLIRELTQMAENYAGISYFGGIGSIVYRLRNVRESYKEAGKAFASRFFVKWNHFAVGNETAQIREAGSSIDTSEIRSKKEEHALLEGFLKSGTVEEVPDFIEEYFQPDRQQNYESLLYRQYMIMDIYFIVSDFLKSLKLMEELPQEYKDINAFVMRINSQEEMIHQIEGFFNAALHLRDNHSKKRYSIQIEEAKKYISENYQNEEMSLGAVAAQIGMTPNYFSTIFSGETGQTFVEYLTQVRIEKAKELLMCSGKRTSDIGYEVGYKDAHYFSYIFRKTTGVSPKEFKNRRKEEKGCKEN